MGWLGDWAKRIQITIDNGDIDSVLSNFPILIYLSSSSGINGDDLTCIFDELGVNKFKIAITTSDGETQCYVEIEKWDNINEKAWLWIKVPSIVSDVNTILYLYYDNTQDDNTDYVGDPNSIPAENVWNFDFKLVTHMQDDPDTSHIRDSTSNDNDGTKTGANEPIEAIGKIGKAQDFDGDNDCVTLVENDSLDIESEVDFTVCAWIKTTGNDEEDGRVIAKRLGEVGYELYVNSTAGYLEIFLGDTSGYTTMYSQDFDLTDGVYHLIVFKREGNQIFIYIDGEFNKQQGTTVVGDLSNANPLLLGKYNGNIRWFDGIIDEVRILKKALSAAEIKADYESERDHLLTFVFERDFSELGAGAETFGIPFKALPFNEAGGGIDGFVNPYRTMGFSDQGLSSDIFSKVITLLSVQFSDVGLGTDAFEIPHKEMKFGEAGYGTDVFEVAVFKYFVDAGNGVDVFESLYRELKFEDAGLGTEAFTMIVEAGFSDVGSGIDNYIVPYLEVRFIDEGIGQDSYTVAFKTTEFSELGLGTDIFKCGREMFFSDIGHGSDVFSEIIIFQSINFSDIGLGTDVFTIPYKEMKFVDVGNGIDTFVMDYKETSFADTGFGVDAFFTPSAISKFVVLIAGNLVFELTANKGEFKLIANKGEIELD